MSMDIELNKDQLPKIILSNGFLGKVLGNVMGNLVKKAHLTLLFLWLKMFFLN